MNDSLALPISDVSSVGEVRREAERMARGLGFDDTEIGRASVVATEIARNLALHATQGRQVLLRALEQEPQVGLEILGLDQGPGIVDLPESLRDGFSTRGTAGIGMGAIRRLSLVSDVYSLAEQGTVVLAQMCTHGERRGGELSPLVVGAVSRAKPGGRVNGDVWSVVRHESGALVLVTDGLGHGLEAAEASRSAAAVFASHPHLMPASLLPLLHEALRKTRGVAAAVVHLDIANSAVRFAGVGNISGQIVTPEAPRAMVSHDGTLGVEARRFQEFEYVWPENGVIVLHSDGLSASWNLNAYPGLLRKHPSVIAGALYRDFGRERDDATVVVVKRGQDD